MRLKNIPLVSCVTVQIFLFTAWLAAPCARGGVTYTLLHQFVYSDAGSPYAGLIQANDGNFYGTTSFGGANGFGNVFKMTPNGSVTTILSFETSGDGVYPYGAYPYGEVIQGKDGFLYGTALSQGTYSYGNYGTVFKMTTNGAVIWSYSLDGTNGSNPYGPVVQAADGYLYGTTAQGGTNAGNEGTVFKISTNGVFTSLFSFSGTTGPYLGRTPEAGLALGNDGTLYGTTAHGGTNDYGTVFKLSTNGVFTSLFSFTGSNTSFEARSPVLQAKDGYLYGTTIFGGSNGVGTGYGAIYKLKADGSSYKELYVFGTVTNSFSYPSDGAFAYAGLIQATDGNFYSTTGYGGIATNGSVGVHGGYGTIYRITPDGDFTTLYSFDYGEACVCSYGLPYARLVQAKDGNFYGTTWSASGTIFRLSVPMPAVFQTPPVTNNTFTLNWSAVASQTYQIQYKTNFAQTNWTDFGSPILASNGVMSVSDSTTNDSSRFYRVVLLP